MHTIRHGRARPRRVILAGMAIMALLLPLARSGAAAAATAEPGLRLVTYLGYSFKVPAGWRVVQLDQHRRACVRFDRNGSGVFDELFRKTVGFGPKEHAVSLACDLRHVGIA